MRIIRDVERPVFLAVLLIAAQSRSLDCDGRPLYGRTSALGMTANLSPAPRPRRFGWSAGARWRFLLSFDKLLYHRGIVVLEFL